jgi:hypothetical protein
MHRITLLPIRESTFSAACCVVLTTLHLIGSGIAHADDSEGPRTGDLAKAQAQRQTEICARLLPSETVKFSGLYPAIESRLPLSNFRLGQIVEINPRIMSDSEAREYIGGLKALGARVSIYLVGGHCDLSDDCNDLPSSVQLGSTGSWNWNEGERRILNITHPAVLTRLAKGIESGWQLGANYIRIDNLHHPAGSTHPRTPAQMKTIIDLGQDIEDRLRANGTIGPDRVTGLVAHNNLVSWEQLIEQGKLRRPPAFLTSERTGQLAAFPRFEGDARMKRGQLSPRDVPDIQAGQRLAEHFQIRYTIVEFRRSHDLAHPGKTYELPQSYVDAIQRLPGVTEVVVIPNESKYVGRGEVFWGSGPKTLPKMPDLIAAMPAGRACSLKALPR